MGIPDYEIIDNGELASRQNGRVGGNMTKRMVGFAEAVGWKEIKHPKAFKIKNTLQK